VTDGEAVSGFARLRPIEKYTVAFANPSEVGNRFGKLQ
jgi:hypothetical protein